MPTILQLSDLHVEPRGRLAFGRCDSAGLLESIRPWLVQAAEKVDAVVVTGDIGCDGNEDAYRIVKDVFTGAFGARSHDSGQPRPTRRDGGRAWGLYRGAP